MEKRKIRGITPCKVVQGHRNRYQWKARICDLLWVINSSWHPISHRFGVITLCVLSPFGGLRDNVRCSSCNGLDGKHVGFLLVLIELFFARCYSWGATGENRSKIGDFAPALSVWPKISGRRGSSPPIIFACIVRPMNALQLCRWEFFT